MQTLQPCKQLTPQVAKQSYLPWPLPSSPFPSPSPSLLSPPLPEQAARAQSSGQGWFPVIPSLLSLWLPPFSCLALPSGPLAPWGVDSPLGGFVTSKTALLRFLASPARLRPEDFKKFNPRAWWALQGPRSLITPLPLWGAGRTVEFAKQPETPGSPSQGKKELPKVG